MVVGGWREYVELLLLLLLVCGGLIDAYDAVVAGDVRAGAAVGGYFCGEDAGCV